uniref:Putative kat8 regulatory nsl complex subunit 1 n=1 Tax=Anopheles triannulatus TaxID=58253 RepID=A0A2M4A4E8_9DIPT
MGLAVATSVTTNALRSDAVEAMAPALTEPLSQSKLSSSAASGASPRTSSSTTTTSTLGTTLAPTDAVTSFVDSDAVTVQPNQQAPLTSSDSAPAEALVAEGTTVCSTAAVTAGNSSTFVPQAGLTAETVAPLPVASGAEEATIGGTTVDDIQNNNSNGGPGGLKRLPDKDRDLIELALEQIHQEASIGESTVGSIPVMGVHPAPAGTVLDGLEKATISTAPTSMNMPVNILQPAAAGGSSVQIPIDMANTPIVLSNTTGETFQALSNAPLQHQQAPPPPPPAAPSQQEMLHVPAQDSSQSSIGAGSELGLQKDYLKESAEMDQMIHELSTADIDLLQVLKSFDGSGLLLFSDVDVANLCDGPDGTSGLAAASPNKDRERLELHAEIVKRQLQMQRKYDFLMRRLNKLAARYMGQHVSEETAGLFEYVQRYWKKREKEHAKQQLQFNHPNATTAAPMTSMAPATGGQQWPDIIPYQAPSAGEQQPEKLKPISANALKTFTKRLEGISNTICSTQSKRIRYSRYFTGVNNTGGTAAEQSPAAGGYGNISNTIPLFEKGAIAELEQTAGLLHAELRQVQTNIDSDATLSSSGGESADESVPYTNASQLPLAISKRALWKWSKDRAAVASRWTWLLSRVADLEYRIRQHNELLMKIRINKGPITLEDPIQEAINAGGSGTNQQHSVNGYRGQLPGSSKPLTVDNDASITDEEEDTMSCSRSRPYNREKFRKRKLLQTPNLHIISKRAARSSNIKCGCQWPLQPCALCTGRTDPTAPRDPPATMPFAERVALLDSSYHPVLSFPEDTSHSIHLEAIMRLPDVQNRMIRTTHTSSSIGMGSTKHGISSSYKHLSTSSSRAGGSNASFFSSGDEGDHTAHGKRYISSDGKRKAESSSGNKYKSNDRSFTDGGNKSKKSKSRRDVMPNNRKSGYGTQAMADGSGYKLSGSNGHYHKNNHQSKSRKSSHSYDHHGDGLQDGSGSVSRSKNSSPTPNNQRNEKRHRISYDIDNIVIPYSMAASNRISLPQYKDIAIPKWRIVDDEEDDGAPEQTDRSQLNTPTKANSQGALSPSSSTTTATASESCSIVLTGESVVPDIASGDEKSEAKSSTQPPNGTKASSSSTSSKLVGDNSALSTVAGNSVESQQQQLIVIPAQDEEDISEEAIQLKHERALQEERKKFRTYMKFPWSRPRANRRTESRAGSSGANTPDPPSPAPPTTMVDHDSSPTCPSTPLTPQDGQMLSETNVINAINKSLHKKERRRTVSSKRDEQQQQQQHAQQATGSNTPPDTREIVNPYESLQFPLADEVYEQMLRTMPSDHVTLVEDDCLIEKLPQARHPNNNVLLVLKSSMDLAPASLGLTGKNPLSSNVSCSSTTMSVNETDLEEFDDEDLMLAKRTENQRIMERLLNSRDASQRYEIVPPTAKPMLDEDEQLDDEETDTGESLFVEEDDPNDPEWYDRPPGRVGGSGGGANASGRS